MKKTGYPHLDNIHKTYYNEADQKEYDVNQPMYKYLEQTTHGFDGTAISFYGQETSYDELKYKIGEYAKSFHHMGIRQGDTVTFFMPSSPETYIMFYALDVIGAKRNMVDLRTSISGLEKYINESDSEYFICLENFPAKNIKELMNKTTTKNVLVTKIPVNAIDSPFKRKALSVGQKFWERDFAKLGDGVVLAKDFHTFNSHVNENVENPLDPKASSTYVHTSGTLSFPKTVMTSDEKQNIIAMQYDKSLMDFAPHDKYLAIMPPWIIYGIMAFHTSFATKMNVYPVFDPENEKFDELILKHKPNHAAGVPNHYISLMESPLVTPETDLSFAKVFACGGAPVNSEKQEEINNFLKEHGATAKLAPGYSFSENNSIGTVNQVEYNKLGSVGILLPDLEGMIVDPDTLEPLKYNEEGVICLRGDIMDGYLHDEEETNKVIKTIEGKDWALSGDLGYFDEEGFLFINGRQKNVIIKPDGFKIAPNEIESKICTHPDVKNCIVFGSKDPNFAFGDRIVAYIELRDDVKVSSRIAQEIKQICEEKLSSYYRPQAYYFDKIIYTPMMKDDKNKMREKFEQEENKSYVRKRIFGSNIYK